MRFRKFSTGDWVNNRGQKVLAAFVLWVAKEFVRVVLLDDLTLIHEAHALSYSLCKAHSMRYAPHRDALIGHIDHDIEHFLDPLRGKRRSGFFKIPDFARSLISFWEGCLNSCCLMPSGGLNVNATDAKKSAVQNRYGDFMRRFCLDILWDQRIGMAYIKPPLFHWLLTPRGRPRADLGPTLRSKISP